MGTTTARHTRFIMCALSQIWNLDFRKDTKKGDYLEREEKKNQRKKGQDEIMEINMIKLLNMYL